MSDSTDESPQSGGAKIIQADFSKKNRTIHNEKALLFSRFLDQGYVKIALDARKEGVLVPLEFRSDFNLTLEFSSHYFCNDLSFNDQALSARMLFASGSFGVLIPWSAVYALSDEDEASTTCWTDAIPPELLVADTEDEPTQKNAAPFLKLVTD